jgi:hypothetical protein
MNMDEFVRSFRETVVSHRRWWAPMGWVALCESALFTAAVMVVQEPIQLEMAWWAIGMSCLAGLCFGLVSKSNEWENKQ